MKTTPKLRLALPDGPAMAEILVIAGVLALAFALTFARLVRASYDHDEDQFIASARLLADHSLLPYRDYPYFHAPYLTIVYALLLPLTGHYNLFAARAFSFLCGLAAVLALVLITRDLFRRHRPSLRLWAMAAVGLLLVPNPLFTDANRRGWNHSLPVLLT